MVLFRKMDSNLRLPNANTIRGGYYYEHLSSSYHVLVPVDAHFQTSIMRPVITFLTRFAGLLLQI